MIYYSICAVILATVVAIRAKSTIVMFAWVACACVNAIGLYVRLT